MIPLHSYRGTKLCHTGLRRVSFPPRPTKAKKATRLQLIKRLLGFADEPGVIYDHPHANYLPIPGEREARDFLQYRALPLPSKEEVERRKRQGALDAYDYDIREYLAPGEGTVMPTAGRSGWFMPGPKGKPAGFQGDTYRTPAVVGKLPKKKE